MVNESVLLESRTLRTSVLDRTHVLDKVKALSLLPDGLHVTTAMVAAYYEVSERVINQLRLRHREELSQNGMRTLKGTDLATFESYNQSLSKVRHPQARGRGGRVHLAVYTRRAVLNVGMLLRDSEIARQVRAYLLDTEQEAFSRPVDNSIHQTDSGEEATEILRRQVVPMLNVLIEASGEHHRELISLRQDVTRIQAKLVEHDIAISRLQRNQEARTHTGIIETMTAMNRQEFERHIAGLLRRDGCTDVDVHGGDHGGRLGIDITARTADGRTVAVQCKNVTPFRHVPSSEMQKFLGASKVLHRADVALYVATCAFTREALAIAAQGSVTAVHRGLLEAWSAGVRLQALR
ncbi:restriction endonuclease [Streptomyces sp. NPDC059851]|uniref:restriction endonuclease n=1 Tax=Streptomyces sp. NPDC059851 TaxID=3346971 RepID=UPI00365950F4